MEIKIRKMIKGDFPSLYKLLSDPQVMRYLEPPFSEERTRSFMTEAGLCEDPLIYSVELKNRFIGYAIYHSYDEDSMEIGWVLLPEYWGNGYASQITGMLIEKASGENKSVVIECDPDQTVSKRIAEKFGFAYVGRIDGLDVYKSQYPTRIAETKK